MKLKNKKIAIYLPDLTRASGGAEIYGLLMAEVLSKSNEITLVSYKPENKEFDLSSVFAKYGVQCFKTIYIDFINFNHLIGTQVWLQMNNRLRGYDLFINCSQGKMKGLKNVLSIHIIHFPAKRYGGFLADYLNNKYVNSYKGYICNSEYTKFYLKNYWNVDGVVVYPPIAMQPVDSKVINKKENIILAVDRLVSDKKVLEMINAFKTLCKEVDNNYKFVIIGNKDNKELDYYNKILEAIGNERIEVYHDLSKNELVEWYQRSAIFWHAKGFGEELDPEMAEHFGMTTAEAMSNGCVPVVINKAGQKEIVNDQMDGYRWDDLEQLIKDTAFLINNENIMKKLQFQAVNSSEKFLMKQFNERIIKVLENF